MNKKTKITLTLILLLMSLSLIWGCSKTPKFEPPEGAYKAMTGGGYIMFNDTDDTFKMYSLAGYESNFGGNYEFKSNNTILLKFDMGFETLYDMWENYIIPTVYSYDVEVPDGKTFDLICVNKDGETDYTFRSDGTFTYSYDNGTGEIMTRDGTYERDGYILTHKFNDHGENEEPYRMIIYKDKLNSSAYYK